MITSEQYNVHNIGRNHTTQKNESHDDTVL